MASLTCTSSFKRSGSWRMILLIRVSSGFCLLCLLLGLYDHFLAGFNGKPAHARRLGRVVRFQHISPHVRTYALGNDANLRIDTSAVLRCASHFTWLGFRALACIYCNGRGCALASRSPDRRGHPQPRPVGRGDPTRSHFEGDTQYILAGRTSSTEPAILLLSHSLPPVILSRHGLPAEHDNVRC